MSAGQWIAIVAISVVTIVWAVGFLVVGWKAENREQRLIDKHGPWGL